MCSVKQKASYIIAAFSAGAKSIAAMLVGRESHKTIVGHIVHTVVVAARVRVHVYTDTHRRPRSICPFVRRRSSFSPFFFFLLVPFSVFRGSHNCLIVGCPFFIYFFFWLGMAWLLCVQEPILRLTPTSLPPSSASHIVVHEMMQTTLKVLPFQKENKNKRKKAKQKMGNDGQCFFFCVFSYRMYLSWREGDAKSSIRV